MPRHQRSQSVGGTGQGTTAAFDGPDRQPRRTGSQKAAAADMAIDPAQLTRQLANGHLTIERLEALPPTFAAELGRLLVETFGAIESPQARLLKESRELREAADRLEYLAEFVA